MRRSIRLELRHVPDCPNLESTRRLLSECLRELNLRIPVEEVEGDYPSPSVCVDGVDVMGEPGFTEAACRLDVPTRERVLAALRRASDAGGDGGS